MGGSQGSSVGGSQGASSGGSTASSTYVVTEDATTNDNFFNSSEPGCRNITGNPAAGIVRCDDYEDGVGYVSCLEGATNAGPECASSGPPYGTDEPENDGYRADIFARHHIDPNNGVDGINQWVQCGDESLQYGFRSRCGVRGLIPPYADGCPASPAIPNGYQGTGKEGFSAYLGLPGAYDEIRSRWYFKIDDDVVDGETLCHNNQNNKVWAFTQQTNTTMFWKVRDIGSGYQWKFEYSSHTSRNYERTEAHLEAGVQPGRWYAYEVYLKLDTSDAPHNGIVRVWITDCGADMQSCSGTQDLFIEHTDADLGGVNGNGGFDDLFLENWSNGGGSGLYRWDQLIVKAGADVDNPIGWMTYN